MQARSMMQGMRDTLLLFAAATFASIAAVACGGGGQWIAATPGVPELEIPGGGPLAVESWTVISGKAEEGGESLVPLADGGFLIVGKTKSTGEGGSDLLFVRTDAAGSIEWSRTFGGKWDDYPGAAVETADGSFLVVGNVAQQDFRPWKGWFAKLGSGGETLWERTIDAGWDSSLMDVVELPGGSFLLAGSSKATEGSASMAMIVKVDGKGTTFWRKMIEVKEGTACNRVCSTADGGFLLGGWTGPHYQEDLWMGRIDTKGEVVWKTALGSDHAEESFGDMECLPDGGGVISGFRSEGEAPARLVFFGVDRNGVESWSMFYEFEWGGQQLGPAILATPGGGYILAGVTSGVPSPTDVYEGVETRSRFGILVWTNDKGVKVAVEPIGIHGITVDLKDLVLLGDGSIEVLGEVRPLKGKDGWEDCNKGDLFLGKLKAE